jgi:hypothetical protein
VRRAQPPGARWVVCGIGDSLRYIASSTTRALPGALALVLALCAAPAGAAAASVNWAEHTQSVPSGGDQTAVSCPSEALCVGVNAEGDALATNNPTALAPSWSPSAIDSEKELGSVSCAPGGPCVAVDAHGNAFVNETPGGSAWRHTIPLGSAEALMGVSCPSSSLCVAVGAGGQVWTNTAPGVHVWERTSFGGAQQWTAVSCSSESLCVAVSAQGTLIASTNPTGGRGAWHEQKLGIEGLDGVSCASQTLCVAVDKAGSALASSDPGEAAPSWTITPIDGERLTGVSCTALGLCVAVDGAGRALASGNAGAAVPSWSQPAGVDSHGLAGVSCVANGFCMALDSAGGELSGRVPAPAATTLPPTQLTSGSAVLSGVVETGNATLLACTFEVGPSAAGGAFTQTLPCSLAASAIVGRQEVSAALTNLAPNTTYHYRLTAANTTGGGTGETIAFTTAVSSQIALVVPHPSITGTPAVAQHLSCHANTPAGSEARLSYAWVRDLIPIPNTDASSYTVKGQDSGHHLQCQVTATNGGGSYTAKSAFVTIPMGGAPVSAGETKVGGATFAHGRVSVPIACSSHASGGCRVGLRLMVVETLSGGRVVAVAARASGRARGGDASVRHVTLTLASAHAHLQAGASTTVSAGMGGLGRRLLASHRRFTAYLYVSGTVIGVIESQLARQLVTLSSSSSHAASHDVHRR